MSDLSTNFFVNNMVANCGANLARWSICLSNFIFLIASIFVVVIGSWLAADKSSFISTTLNITHSPYSPVSNLVGDEAKQIINEFVEPAVINQAAYILIAIGAFILIISFLGYCGAIQESRVLLTTYSIFLIIIFALEITLILLFIFRYRQANDHTRGFLKSTINKYYTIGDTDETNPKDAITIGWDIVMAQMKCCGVDNWEDFRTARLFVEASSLEGLGRQVPESCCHLKGEINTLLLQPEDPNCIINPNPYNSYSDQGCYSKFSELVTLHQDWVIVAAVVVGMTQLFAIIFSFCLCKAVGQERDYHYKY